jgi:hypothetical protein
MHHDSFLFKSGLSKSSLSKSSYSAPVEGRFA